MLISRLVICFIVIFLLVSYCCDAQQEIRKAVRAKKNRKIKEGKQAIQRVKNQVRAPLDRAGAKINKKYQNTRRKVQQIEDIINS
ncbi:hypothetical protein I4U23_023456 [Adineta vaga]|nr:hypothetical protein I4U23_023456 [Adineta vaga]